MIPSEDGCSWYRLKLPGYVLDRVGANVRFVDGYRQILDSSGRFRRTFLEDVDLIVMQRPAIFIIRSLAGEQKTFPHYTAIISAFEAGKAVVVDNDDFVLDVPEGNPAHMVYGRQEVRDAHAESVRLVASSRQGVCTFSTPDLADLYRRTVIGQLPSYVVENFLPMGLEPVQFEKPDRFTVMLTGSLSHKVDWEPVAEALSRFASVFGDRVRVVIQGFDPRRYAGKHLDARVIVSHLESTSYDFEYLPWTDYSNYLLTLSKAHVIISWLVPNALNVGKSDIKAKEAAYVGAYFVGPASPAYSKWAAHNPSVSMALKNSDELYPALAQLYEQYEGGIWPDWEEFWSVAERCIWDEQKGRMLLDVYSTVSLA